MSTPLLISYYGDDFTGSTDVMESLALSGVPTVLFLEPPAAERLARFPDVRAVGIAGTSRGKSPAWMDDHLPDLFASLQRLGARLCHYKVCSTFDSSPEIGSIGRALDIGGRIFGSAQVPVVIGAPALRRYQVFGNLFATVGDTNYRIDRHPTMSCHPVTPMKDSDLRRHLGAQTDRSVGLMDILSIWANDYTERDETLAASSDTGVLLYDVLDEPSLRRVGELLWRRSGHDGAFCVGSSGVEYALVAHWRASGDVPLTPTGPLHAGETDRIFVMSGSCSPVTAGQIRWALDSGYRGYHVDPERILDPLQRDEAIETAIDACSAQIDAGHSVVAYSSVGAPDAPTRAMAARDPAEFAHALGSAQGVILRETIRRTGLTRVVVAGGDTSGHASQQLGAYALTTLAPIAPGSPLCTAHADGPDFDGLQIALKGGQVGTERYFEQVRAGSA